MKNKYNFDTAKPHSIKKFEMISSYTDAWARKILGFQKSEGLVYIDCMSNCGYYLDDNSNMVEGTAIKVVKALEKLSENYPQKTIDIYFNDYEQWKVDYLKAAINSLGVKKVEIHYSNLDSSEFLNSLSLKTFSNKSTLLIYDPFKAAIDWDALQPYLNGWCEVIINHMIHDTTRGAKQAKKQEVIDRYEQTYKCSINEILNICTDRDKLDSIVIDIIEKSVSNNPREHYIASFPFYNRTKGLVYNLLMCTSNIEGMKLYKKVAWKNFGNRSSTKKDFVNTQLQFSFDDGSIEMETDEHCYNITDIAMYVYNKYHTSGKVLLDIVYYDLDRHPIFPTDGYKNDIKNELKSLYGVSFQHINGKQYVLFK